MPSLRCRLSGEPAIGSGGWRALGAEASRRFQTQVLRVLFSIAVKAMLDGMSPAKLPATPGAPSKTSHAERWCQTGLFGEISA